MAIEETKIICLGCPVGCTLIVTHDGKNIMHIAVNKCDIGIKFATTEITDPRRIVATTVKVKGGIHPLLAVYTASPFPKPLIMELMKELRKIELEAPVKMDQVVVKNALGTGVDIIASRDLPSATN
jgi:CxxC motif-containing protein